MLNDRKTVLPEASRSAFIDFKNKLAADIIANWIGPGHHKILDVGCGSGQIDKILLEKNMCEIIGIDINNDLQNKINLKNQKNFTFILADVSNLPFKQESFDVVISLGHSCAAAIPGALPEIRRVLKNNGILIMDYINHFSLYTIFSLFNPLKFPKNFNALKNAFDKNLNVSNLEPDRVNYHLGLLGLKNYLEKMHGFKIHQIDHLYSLPNFFRSEKFLHVDRFLSRRIGPLFSRAILIKLKKK